MASAIDFYFDFSSPYGYLAAEAIDDVGARHGIDVAWRPFLLGAVFKITGARPLASPGHLEAWPRSSADAATFRGHWNPTRILRSRLPVGCGMHLALMSCREALHARVESFCEEAA